MKRITLLFLSALVTIVAHAQFSGVGSGTSSDPYQITNANELAEMAYFLGDSHKGACFKLMNDIDLSQWIADNNPTQGWIPIGVFSNRFKGILNGDNKTISGLFIYRPNVDYVGFFGYVDAATISNLIIKGSSVTGNNQTGGLVGEAAASATISNCQLTLNDEIGVLGQENTGGLIGCSYSSTITECEYSGNVNAKTNVGGIIGRSESSIVQSCRSNSNINIDTRGSYTDNIGGIIGYSKYDLTCVKNRHQGDIKGENYCGGIIGRLYVDTKEACVSYCSHLGTIIGSSELGGTIGGSRIEGSNARLYITIENCNATGTLSGKDFIGGILGNDEYSSSYGRVNISNSYFNGDITGNNYIGGVAGVKQCQGQIMNCYSNVSCEGNMYLGGITGILYRSSLSSNCAIVASIDAKGNYGRICGKKSSGTIGANGSQQGNRAYAKCVITIEGTEQVVLDDELNGTGISLTALKDKNTYIGLGWDFTDTWTINNGKTFPYLKWEKRVSAIELNKTTANLTIGESTTIIASVTPTDADLKDLNWTTSDESIVKVESDGTITAVAEGTASITATAKDGSEISATCIVIVSNNPDFNNIIYYTSSDGQAITPYKSDVFGANIVSNTYKNGKGIITFDGDVTSIGDYAFYHCSSLTSITIPESVTSIGSSAFEYCSGLTSITIPNSVTSIGKLAFSDCSSLTCIIVESGNPSYDSRNDCNAIIETSTNTMLWGCQNTIIPESVTSIGDHAFSGCSGLTSITIPNSVTSIGYYAFANCSRLTDVYVEWESPLSISNYVFANNLSNVTLHVPYETKELYEAADVWKDFGNIVYDPMMEICYTSTDGKIVIPNDEEAFGVAILNNIYKNGQGKIGFTENVATIGRDAFAECSTLESMIIPDGVTSIGRYAFDACEALASVSIPASVNTIGSNAFRDCDVLENVSNYALIPQTLNSNTFTHYGTLHVVDGYKEIYAAADVWKNFTIIDDLPDANAAYITDGTVYDNEEDSDPSKIVYTRTFSSADKWQALYVPFSIPVDVLTENGLEVAELNNIHMYDTDGDKQFDKTTLEFLYLTDGETEANYPYLIKADKVGELKLTLKDVELKAAAETQIECASTRKVFKIKGTYTGVSGADMFNNNYYAVGGGTLVRAASADNALKPQRWYMCIENKDGSPVDYYAPKMRIMINGMEIDEEETGIQDITTPTVEDVVYTLDGRKMNASALPSGIYVKNHQKIIVR